MQSLASTPTSKQKVMTFLVELIEDIKNDKWKGLICTADSRKTMIVPYYKNEEIVDLCIAGNELSIKLTEYNMQKFRTIITYFHQLHTELKMDEQIDTIHENLRQHPSIKNLISDKNETN